MGESKRLSYGFCGIMEQKEKNLGLILFHFIKIRDGNLTNFVLMLPSLSWFLEDTGKPWNKGSVGTRWVKSIATVDLNIYSEP